MAYITDQWNPRQVQNEQERERFVPRQTLIEPRGFSEALEVDWTPSRFENV